MAKWHPRSDWQSSSEPVTGPAFPAWSQITDGVVVHFPGHDNPPKTPEQVPQAIRNTQHYYLTDPKRGYSLGYNHKIDPWGDIWEVRGFDIRNAANSGGRVSYNVNHTTISVQLMTPLSGKYTDAMRKSLSEYVYECDRRAGRTLQVNGHSHWEWTDCPGDPLEALIVSGVRIEAGQPGPPQDMSNFKITNPVRIVDTRVGTEHNAYKGSVKAGQSIAVKPHGFTPPDASGVILTLTGLGNTNGFFTFWSGEGFAPVASNLNLSPGTYPNNMVWVPLKNGQFKVLSGGNQSNNGLIIDQVGWFFN